MARITRRQGRSAFGGDPAAYDQGRPDYPPALMRYLTRACGVKAGIRVFEVGPGPGRFTEAFAAHRPQVLAAIEPDPRLAAYLKKRLTGVPGAEVLCKPFEEADLPESWFDLGMAATSFHWVNPTVGLTKAYRALKPGGHWAMWWNIYGEVDGKDAFSKAATKLFADIPKTPSHQKGRRQAHGLQAKERARELKAAGFVGIRYKLLRWKVSMTSDQMVALMATFSPILLLTEARRKAFLADLRRVVNEQFGGRVVSTYLTAIHTGRKPLRPAFQARN